MLHLMFGPAGMRGFVVEWDTVAQSIAQRISHETIGNGMDDATTTLLDALFAHPDVDPAWRRRSHVGMAPGLPMIPIGFTWRGRMLSYFSMVTSVWGCTKCHCPGAAHRVPVCLRRRDRNILRAWDGSPGRQFVTPRHQFASS